MREFLDDYQTAEPWLRQAGFGDLPAAHRNFVAIAEQAIPLDLLEELKVDLAKSLPACPDADMAFNNFERMLRGTRSPLSMLTFLHRKPGSLLVLLQLFGSSQYFSDLIVENPEFFDFLWEEGHLPLDPQMLEEDLLGELRMLLGDEDAILHLIRRSRQRELLRIGYRDIVLGEPLERITSSISDLADCLVRVALWFADQKYVRRHGQPRSSNGKISDVVVLAMGKLGGRELNYSSDIDLMVIHSSDGRTDGCSGSEGQASSPAKVISNAEFFTYVVRDLVRLLSANTPHGQAYRVDLRLRPHGKQGPLALSLRNTLSYYDQQGRTWERQALVKVRTIAGSEELGRQFVSGISSFVYRRYLSHVEINEIKAIKRRIESKTRHSGGETTDLKTGHGGIRDIEFVTQFLQLVNGGTLPEIRQRNTLKALRRLARKGCINKDEHTALETSYRFLRKAEHRLQFMSDLQTHRIPESPKELDNLALRLGYSRSTSFRIHRSQNEPDEIRGPGELFLKDLRSVTERNRNILKRFMHDIFPEDELPESGGEPETDLVLDPDPQPERIREVLGRYRFTDYEAAYKNLMQLAREEIPFLSSVRCRHFLASIAAHLLQAVAQAPDPDMAMLNLERVSKSLGAKGVLWESFSVNPPLLRLYVNLCSQSQYLSEILINNPGMIDELLDTLVLNQSPTSEEMQKELSRLLKGAREVDPILHSFKNTRLLEVGVHDILGKHSMWQTAHELSKLARIILEEITDLHYNESIREHGIPMMERGTRKGKRSENSEFRGCPSRFVILALGKFGGGELNYHSDLDLLLVYEGDGKTIAEHSQPTRGTTTNSQFYTELAQRIIRTSSQMGPLGRLYKVDLRLRPAGQSGSLVLPFEKFDRYYTAGGAALWERQALTRARVVHGDRDLGERVMSCIKRAICLQPWHPELAEEIHHMRRRLEESRGPGDLKRRPGGIVDVEFAVQMLQIKCGAEHPEILESNIWDALECALGAKLWTAERVSIFHEGYTFLRTLESRLRIVHDFSREDLPEDPDDLAKLAFRLGYEGTNVAQQLQSDVDRHTRKIRQQYLACLVEEGFRP